MTTRRRSPIKYSLGLVIFVILFLLFLRELEEEYRYSPWATVIVSGMLLLLVGTSLIVLKPKQAWDFEIPERLRIAAQILSLVAGAVLIAWSFKL